VLVESGQCLPALVAELGGDPHDGGGGGSRSDEQPSQATVVGVAELFLNDQEGPLAWSFPMMSNE
jgi:hypothetical protein